MTLTGLARNKMENHASKIGRLGYLFLPPTSCNGLLCDALRAQLNVEDGILRCVDHCGVVNFGHACIKMSRPGIIGSYDFCAPLGTGNIYGLGECTTSQLQFVGWMSPERPRLTIGKLQTVLAKNGTQKAANLDLNENE